MKQIHPPRLCARQAPGTLPAAFSSERRAQTLYETRPLLRTEGGHDESLAEITDALCRNLGKGFCTVPIITAGGTVARNRFFRGTLGYRSPEESRVLGLARLP